MFSIKSDALFFVYKKYVSKFKKNYVKMHGYEIRSGQAIEPKKKMGMMNLHIQFSRIQSAYIKSELICQCVCCKQELNFYSSFRLYLYSVRFVAKPSALFSSRPILKPGNILSMRRWQTETRTNRFFFFVMYLFVPIASALYYL